MKPLIVLIILLLVIAGIYLRLPQVALFIVAAAAEAPWRDEVSIPHGAVDGWESSAPRREMRTARPSGTAVTYHPEYHKFRASQAVRCLEAAAALEVEYLRSDVRWSAVLPDGKTPDQSAFAWYRSFFRTAHAYGLQPVIVLSNPPKAVRRLPAHELLQRWQLFVEQVILNLGDLCKMYQVVNEPNNPVYGMFDAETLPQAVVVASRLIKGRVNGAKVVVNFLVDIPYWRSKAERLLSQTGTSIDIVGIDHYPGTWTIGPRRSWAAGIRMLSEIDPASPGTAWYGRELAIAETGYASNLPGLRGPDQQQHFFLDLERRLRRLGTSRGALAFVGFYELCDSDSRAFLNPEAHFGLLEDDCVTRKPAFAVAQRISLERSRQ